MGLSIVYGSVFKNLKVNFQTFLTEIIKIWKTMRKISKTCKCLKKIFVLSPDWGQIRINENWMGSGRSQCPKSENFQQNYQKCVFLRQFWSKKKLWWWTKGNNNFSQKSRNSFNFFPFPGIWMFSIENQTNLILFN